MDKRNFLRELLNIIMDYDIPFTEAFKNRTVTHVCSCLMAREQVMTYDLHSTMLAIKPFEKYNFILDDFVCCALFWGEISTISIVISSDEV